MNKSINITFIQSFLFWEDPEKNISEFDNIIENINEATDLIILPEMFTTGFSVNPPFELGNASSEALEWMKSKAKSKNIAITGSVIHYEEKKLFNRMYWVNPDGSFFFYDKKYLFSLAGEHKTFTAGTKKVIINYKGFKFTPLICYDLRFPVWCKNRYNKITQEYDYDIAIFIANWPEKRIYHWEQLLIARAIENQVYVVGVNRIGEDNSGIFYNGNSMMIHPTGKILFKAADNTKVIHTETFHKTDIIEYRTQMPAGLDWD